MKHIISLKEQSKEDLLEILNMAMKLKEMRKKGEMKEYLKYKTLIMLFEKTSTRTRLSFEAGMTELGGHAIFLDSRTTQMAIGTDFIDEIKATMLFGDLLMYRAKRIVDVETAAKLNMVPVIDACSEKYHPCQALGDMLTMMEYSGGIDNIRKVAWLSIENNVSNSLKAVCSKLGIQFVLATPETDQGSIDQELNQQSDSTGLVTRETDLDKALKDVDYIHTDTWINMEFFNEKGEVISEFKDELERRKKIFMPYQINARMLEKYAPQAKIMHCMACHIGYEISRDALDHPNSLIFDQAENRMHVQKAIILWLLGIKV